MKSYQLNFIERMHFLLRSFRLSDDVRTFIVAQFCLESNYGTSDLAIDAFNICGMRYPLVRISSSIGQDNNGFAKYDSLFVCIVDYFLCLQYHRPMSGVWQNVEDFKHFIRGWYCPEIDYLDKITSIFNQLKSYYHE